MKLYRVIDNQNTGFMDSQLWTATQIRAHLYNQALDQWDEKPQWRDFTLDFCCEMWNIELEEQKDLRK